MSQFADALKSDPKIKLYVDRAERTMGLISNTAFALIDALNNYKRLRREIRIDEEDLGEGSADALDQLLASKKAEIKERLSEMGDADLKSLTLFVSDLLEIGGES